MSLNSFSTVALFFLHKKKIKKKLTTTATMVEWPTITSCFPSPFLFATTYSSWIIIVTRRMLNWAIFFYFKRCVHCSIKKNTCEKWTLTRSKNFNLRHVSWVQKWNSADFASFKILFTDFFLLLLFLKIYQKKKLKDCSKYYIIFWNEYNENEFSIFNFFLLFLKLL